MIIRDYIEGFIISGILKVTSHRFVLIRYYDLRSKLAHHLIVPVVLYGSDIETIISEHQKLLSIFERRVLRIIFKAVCTNEGSDVCTKMFCSHIII